MGATKNLVEVIRNPNALQNKTPRYGSLSKSTSNYQKILEKMGCAPSRYERREYDRYIINDGWDRDDFDDPCGCGPWYGGEDYRWRRRRYLPGYGSPPGNYFGPGGYADFYAAERDFAINNPEREILAAQTAIVPYRGQSQVLGPIQSQVAVPIQPGYIAGGEYPYRRSSRIMMW